jgi:hypothetical protein
MGLMNFRVYRVCERHVFNIGSSAYVSMDLKIVVR